MNKIPIIDEKDIDRLIEECLNKGGTLVTPSEVSQMLINVAGICICEKPRPDGRWQGYILREGKRNFVYGKSKEEVALKLKDYYKNGIPQKRKKKKATPTLSEWLDKWIELYKVPNVKPKTIEAINTALKAVKLQLGEIPIGSLKTDEIQQFLLSMKGERLRDMCLSYLNQSLEKARKQGVIKINPCEAVEIKKHKYAHKNALTPDEQAALLNNIQGKLIEPIFRLLLTTGIRVGEALALTAQDVDYAAKTISINKNAVFINNKKVIQDTPKTAAGVRTVPVPENALKLLPKSGELFPTTYNAVRCMFARLSKSTGINVTPHILRHTYATRLEEAGCSPKLKQYLLGHSTLEMTQNTYTDVQKHYVDYNSEKILSVFDF